MTFDLATRSIIGLCMFITYTIASHLFVSACGNKRTLDRILKLNYHIEDRFEHESNDQSSTQAY